jgi:hypothetical protein
MFLVVGELAGSPILANIEKPLHTIRDLIRKENHLSIDVSGGSASGLDE